MTAAYCVRIPANAFEPARAFMATMDEAEMLSKLAARQAPADDSPEDEIGNAATR
jgi:hypothetical protein